MTHLMLGVWNLFAPRNFWVCTWGLMMGVSFSPLAATAATNQPVNVYIGTYTDGKSRGIYSARFDPDTGRLSAPQLAAESKNPSFLALHPNRQFLYAVNEVGDFGGQKSGAVSAFRIEPETGQLKLLGQQPSGGTVPCHLSVDATGRCLLVANYGNGSVAALPIQSDGNLGPPSAVIQHQGSGPNRQRQAGPHGHFIVPDPANRFALACDLGLDKVLVYRLDAAKATLNPNDPPFATVQPGAGPRHLAFHPNGKWVYVLNEINSTLTQFDYSAEQGRLQQGQTISTLPESFNGQNTCAEVQVHPSGKFVYASNRGLDSIAVLASDLTNGKLTLLQHQATQGKTPRHFTLDPTGNWLLAANQDSDTVVIFPVDVKSGRLGASAQVIPVPVPVCLLFR